jgi:hypothetical protein
MLKLKGKIRRHYEEEQLNQVSCLNWELHKRAWKGDFAPAQPYDPKVLL